MLSKRIQFLLVVGLIMILLASCTGATEPPLPPTDTPVPAVSHDEDEMEDTEDTDSEDHDGEDGDSEEAEDSEPAPQVIDAAALYADKNCANCHGADREGGQAPALLPERLTSPAEQYIKTITNGSGQMPAWGDDFSQEEIAALVDWLMTDPE